MTAQRDSETDGALIAAAPDLLAEVTRLRALLAEVSDARAAIKSMC